MQQNVTAVKNTIEIILRKIRKLVIWLVVLAVLFIGLGSLISTMFAKMNFYSFLFSRKVVGVIEKVERVQLNVSLIQSTGSSNVPGEAFSFAVAIKEPSGEIVTASSTDRQWAVVKQGQCAEATYFPYPPWELDKSGTYHSARLTKLSECSP